MCISRTNGLSNGLRSMLRMVGVANGPPAGIRAGAREGARWKGSGAVACVMCAGLALSSSSLADDVLNLYDAQLVTYQASPTSVQDLAPRAGQRGVHLDGSGRAGGLMGGVIPGHSGSDLGFNSKRMLGGYVDLFNGAVRVTDVDLAFPADPGGNWVIGRTYNTRQDDSGHHVSQGPQGNNWAMANPEIALFEGATDDLDVLYVVAGADRYAAFKRIGVSDDEFQGINGATGVVQYAAGAGSEPDTYTLTQPDGTQMVFFGFDGDSGVAAGQLWKKIGPDGDTAFVGDATTGSTAIEVGFDTVGVSPANKLTVAYDSIGNGGRRYTYTYLGGQLTKVEAEICSSGDWSSPGTVTKVGQVDYVYYGSSESYGSDGDLKSVTVTMPSNESGEDLITKKYYRYWVDPFSDSTNPGHASALQYIVEAEGYRAADYDDSTFNDTPLTMSESALKLYAAAYFEYNSSRQVDKAWFNGRCGCAGGLNGEHEITYGTTGSEASPYDDAWKRRAIVEQPDGLYVSTLFDEGGQVYGEVKTHGDPSSAPGDTWATLAVRGSDALVDEIATPANVTAYTHSTGAFTRSNTVGLVRVVDRVSSGSLTGFVEGYEFKTGATGTAYVERQMDYETRGLTIGSATLNVPFVDAQRSVFADSETSGTLAAADYDETTVGRTWWSATATDIGSIRPKAITTTLPAVVTAENGENTTHTRIAYVRQNGHTAFVKAEDDIYDYMEYDDGLLVESIRDATLDAASTYDADPNGVFGITENGDGWGVTTTYAYDDQGRRTQMTAPDGDVSEVYRTVLLDRRSVTVSIPLVTTGPTTYYGPASVSVSDHAGNGVASMQVSLSGGSTTTALSSWIDETDTDPLLAVGHGTVSRYSTAVYTESGALLEESRSYFDIPASGDGTEGTHYDATTFAYDGMGRRIRTKDATGTISRAVYDKLGRMTSSEIGTNDEGDEGGDTTGTNNMVTVSATEYDGTNDGGNSYVTKTTAYTQGSLGGPRATEYSHDVRGRTILTEGAAAPHSLVKLDNLGRTLAAGRYSSVSGLTVSSDPTSVTGNRVALSEMDYDSRGRVWQSERHEITQSTGASNTTLESLTWYDEVGRTIKVQGGQLAKTEYDRLGRATDRFVLGKTDDTLYAHAEGVSGDHVMEQMVTAYESNDSNLVFASAAIQRDHDDTSTTGELDSGADGDLLAFTAANITGRIQISATWYDVLDRPVTSAFYGTNGGSTFDRDGLATPGQGVATVIVSDTTYNADGEVSTSIDPENVATVFAYDDLGRQTSVIRNFVDGTPGTVTDDEDLYTWFEYEDGLRIRMIVDQDADGAKDVAANPSTADDQITRWVYGVAKGTVSTGKSEVASGRMLRAVVYPDSTNTADEGSDIDTSDADVVSFSYNALGQVVRREDQAGNVIETAYDDLGRSTSSAVTTLDADFDGAVRRVEQAYLDRGLLDTVTQYDAATSGTATDEVKYSYDGWGNATKIAQDHDSVISANAHDVEFTYVKATPTGGRKTIRRSEMDFPTGYTVQYSVPATGIGNALVRVDSVKLVNGQSSVTVATYDYLGTSGLVGTTLPEPDVFSERFDSSGDYTQLDRFNRPATWTWTRDLNTTDVDFYDVDITFNERGDIERTIDNVMVGSGGTHYFDRVYALDALGRVLGEERGDWNGSTISTTREERNWSLTATGNWATRDYDLDGSGTDFAEDNTTPLSTHFTNANEWTYRNITTGGSDLDPDHDGNGNMIDDGGDYDYKYDAWNRLTTIFVRDTTNVVTEYRYNGLGQRIAESDGTDTEYLIYDDRWRLISRHDGTSDYLEELLYHQAGLDGYGGDSDIDSVVMRRTFLSTGSPQTEDQRWYVLQNWRQDAVAIIDEAAVQRERLFFSPYGRAFGMVAGDTPDTGFDGEYDGTDDTAISSWSGYDAYVDVDLDGDVDNDDASFTTNASMGWDVLSRDGSTVGYAGYVQDDYVPTVNHVRNRVLKTDLGRWIQRDLAGYIDGPSLYEYSMSQPLALRDPHGLSSRDFFTWSAKRLVLHYLGGSGSTYELTGAMQRNYLKCSNVQDAVSEIRDRVRDAGRQAVWLATSLIDCDCRTPLPRAISFTLKGNGDVPVRRPYNPHVVAANPRGAIIVPQIDICFVIGAHQIRYSFRCGIHAGCTSFPWSLPGDVSANYSCAVSYRMNDRFQDLADIMDLAHRYAQMPWFLKGIGPVLLPPAKPISQWADQQLGTPYLILGKWSEGLYEIFETKRPFGVCTGGD
ncbi:MAG: hypothetical protein NCW75_13890 [Phycisphaera sp.]|nr:MAG: hypothetical protein NCW75_13890 [Phycisphaera sp.]